MLWEANYIIFHLLPLIKCQGWLRETYDIWLCWHQTLQSSTVAGPLTLYLRKLIIATSLTISLIAAPPNRAIWTQQSLINTWADIVTVSLGFHQWGHWRLCACRVHAHTHTHTRQQQRLILRHQQQCRCFLSLYSTLRVHWAKLINLRSHSLTVQSSSSHSKKRPSGKITTRIQTRAFKNKDGMCVP